MAEKSDIAQLIALFKASFPNYNPDMAITAKVFFETLGDLPGETLRAAGLACVTEFGRQFAPSIGEIRQAAIKLNAMAAGIPDAQTAYAEVMAMPRDMLKRGLIVENGENFITLEKLYYSHPFVGMVAEMIGWPRSFPTSEPGVDRAQFVKFYDSQLNAQMTELGRLPALSGYIHAKALEVRGGMPMLQKIVRSLEAK